MASEFSIIKNGYKRIPFCHTCRVKQKCKTYTSQLLLLLATISHLFISTFPLLHYFLILQELLLLFFPIGLFPIFRFHIFFIFYLFLGYFVTAEDLDLESRLISLAEKSKIIGKLNIRM